MKTNKVQIKHKLPSECTTIIVGQEQTADGSMIVARSEDWDAMEAKNYEIFEDTDNGPREFIAKDSPFRCELPEKLWAIQPFLRIISTAIGAVPDSTQQVSA